MIKRIFPEQDITEILNLSLPDQYNILRAVPLPHRPDTDGTVFAIVRIYEGYRIAPTSFDYGMIDWFDGLESYSTSANIERYVPYIVKLDGEGRIGLDATGEDGTYKRAFLLGYIYGEMAEYLYQDDSPTNWYDGEPWTQYPESITLTEPTRASGHEGVTASIGKTVAWNMTVDTETFLFVESANRQYFGLMHFLDVGEEIVRDDLPVSSTWILSDDDKAMNMQGIIFAELSGYTNTSSDPNLGYGKVGVITSGSIRNGILRESARAINEPVHAYQNEENRDFVVPANGVAYRGHNWYSAFSSQSKNYPAFVGINRAIVNALFPTFEATEVIEGSGLEVSGVRVPVGEHYNTPTTKVASPNIPQVDLSEIDFKLSGGSSNTELSNSLGGWISTNSAEATDGILFADVDAALGSRGAQMNVCLYVHNTGTIDAAALTVQVLKDNVVYAEVLLGNGVSEVNGLEPSIPSVEDTLSGVTTKASYSEESAIQLPVIPAGGHVPLWVIIDMYAGTTYNNESFRLKLYQGA